MSTATLPAPTCYRDDSPAVAVEVYIGQGEHLGDYLCRPHALCVGGHNGPDGVLGSVMDAECREAWCRHHADQFSGEETVSGPDIVPLDSDRYRVLLAAQEPQEPISELVPAPVEELPAEPVQRTANQVWKELDWVHRRTLINWFNEAYESGWRPGIHIPSHADELYELTKTLGDR